MTRTRSLPASRRRRTAAAAALAALLALHVAGGCFSERQDAAGPAGPGGDCRIPVGSPIIGGTQALVAIRGFAFQPETVFVKAGTTVTWVNCENASVDPHTTTSGSGAWSSPFLPPGEAYSHRFEAAGSFPYSCIPHPFMHGVVVVQ